MTKLMIACVISAALVTVGGCKKKGDGDAVAKTETSDKPAADKPVAPPPPACPAKAWKEPSGLFCVDAPGFTAGEIEKSEDDDPRMMLYFSKPNADETKPPTMFSITWYPKRDAGEAISIVPNMESDYKNNKGEATGEFAGGKGKFFVFARKDNEQSHKIYAVLQGKKHAYRCEGSSFGAPIAPEVIAACKSLLATD
jgi:hypothetical protein